MSTIIKTVFAAIVLLLLAMVTYQVVGLVITVAWTALKVLALCVPLVGAMIGYLWWYKKRKRQ